MATFTRPGDLVHRIHRCTRWRPPAASWPSPRSFHNAWPHESRLEIWEALIFPRTSWILWWNMLMIRWFFESLASHPLVSIGCGSRLSNPRSRECRSHPRCPEADPAAIPEAMYSRCVSFQDFGGGWLPSNKLFVYIYIYIVYNIFYNIYIYV